MTAETQAPQAPPQPARIDATGTKRRLQALVANGRPLAEIAQHLGWDPGAPGRILDRATVPAATARAVSNLYRRLGDRIPQPQTPAERQRFAAARRLAEKHGWPPSMAWDTEQLDDPDGAPAGGWKGWQRRRVRGPQRWKAVAEDAKFLAKEEGLNKQQIAERLQMTENALERVLSLAHKDKAEAQQASTEREAEAG
jgi:hypothetical protein